MQSSREDSSPVAANFDTNSSSSRSGVLCRVVRVESSRRKGMSESLSLVAVTADNDRMRTSDEAIPARSLVIADPAVQ